MRGHLQKLVAFYHPRCIDPAGGYFGFFRGDGSVHDARTRHLIGTTRMIINYALAWQEFRDPSYVDALRHGLAFLRGTHRNPRTGGYAWVLRDGAVADATNHCYGLAFVTLACARALQCGVSEARSWLHETWELLERHLWEEWHGLYADEACADWEVTGYRGQNSNMHLCEAFIAAYEASGDAMFLSRAALLADHMVNRQAALCGGQVWEHYHSDWSVDRDYNKDDRSNIFRPWGLQPGHQVEWAKLLLILDRHAPEPWRLPRARALFDIAVKLGWDTQHGGLIYGYDPQGAPYDTDKYSWVQVEALATAALLRQRTGIEGYGEWFAKLADYCWRVFVDARTGCWRRILNRDNSRWPEEAPFSGLTDYHTIGAYLEIMNAQRD